MRRRQINVQRAAPKPPVTLLSEVPKGFCRHCGLKVGKGVHFHEKACGARHE